MDSDTGYRAYILRKWAVLAITALLALAAALVSLSAGSASISITDIFSAISCKADGPVSTIIWNIRMPRTATAAIVGIALSLSGCIMQCVLHNPLASSSTLGISQGASFGAALAITMFGAGMNSANALPAITAPYMVTISAFCGGMATTLIMLMLSRTRSSSPSVMILAGVAISAMFSGATTMIQYFADDMMVASIVYWTFGNLGRTGWNEIAMISIMTIAAFVFFLLNRWNYNAISSGSHTAKSLGVDVELLVAASLVLCALITSVSVAFTGCISFIGLIAPHVMRKFVGSDFRFLIPCSSLCGALLLIASDIACRTVAAPVVLPVGSLTSFIGAPLFLYLILRKRRSS